MANIDAVELKFGTKSLDCFSLVSVDIQNQVNQVSNTHAVLKSTSGTENSSTEADELITCQPGTEATLILNAQTTITLFTGIVVEQICRVHENSKEVSLVLKHPIQKLLGTYRSQVFIDKYDIDIIKQILSDHGLTAVVPSNKGVQHEQMIQWRSSDWQFIRQRLISTGFWLLSNPDGQVEIINPLAQTSAKHTLDFSSEASLPISSANWHFRHKELSTKLNVSSWDVKNQKMLTASAGVSPVLWKGGLELTNLKPLSNMDANLFYTSPIVSAECKELSNARLMSQNAHSVQTIFTVKGCLETSEYKLGDTIELQGFGGQLDGEGVISSINHRWLPDSWETEVTLGASGISSIDASLLPESNGLFTGIVGPFKADPLSLNRLQVEVPSLGLPTTVYIWARFAAPYASKESALCLYPEEGDEIILGFFADDPRYPVILGSLNNPINTAPFDYTKENNQKGLVLKKGDLIQQLLIDNQDTALTIGNDKDSLLLNKDGLSVTTEAKMVVSAKQDVTISSDTKFGATGTSGVEIKGAKIDLKQ